MSKGGGNETVTTTSQPPSQFLNAYQGLVGAAQNVTSQPPQSYSGPLVAGFTPQQQQAFSTISNAQGLAQPYINSAASEFGAANAPFYNTVGSYESPYTSAVTAPLQALFDQQNAQQLQQVHGNATAAGAYGGDRTAVADALTAQQQNLSEAPTLANVLQGGYQTGLGAAEQQGWLGEQEAFGLGNLGPTAENAAFTGASANLQAGGLQQQLGQEQLNIPYEEWAQAQAAPYQNLNELAQIVEGTGSISGGTGSSTYPGPSLISQLGGLGISGLGLYGLANQTGALSGLGSLFGAGSAAGAGAGVAGVDAIAAEAPSALAALPAAALFASGGGRVGLQAGGTPGAGLAAPAMNGGFTLPPIPNINLDYIAPAGPQVKGAGPPKAPSVGNPETQNMSPAQMLQGLSAAERLNQPGLGLGGGGGGSAEGGRAGLQAGGQASLVTGEMGAQGPNVQNQIQRFMQMPLDQLQAYAAQMPPSTPMGAIVNRVLQQRRMSPQGSAPQVSSAGGVPIGTGAGLGASPVAGGMADGGLAAPLPETPDMDPHPVVDHSGPTVVVRYPSEGKTLDLGLPSSPGMATAERPGRAAGGAGAPAPVAPSPVTGAGGASPFVSTAPSASGLAIPQVSMSLFADPTGTIASTPVQPGGGLGSWFNALPQYQPPGAGLNASGQYTLPSNALYSPGMGYLQNLNLLGSKEGGRTGFQDGGGLDPGDKPPSADMTDPLSGSPMPPLPGTPPTSLGIGQALKDIYVAAPPRDATPHVLPDPAESQDLSLKGMGVAAPSETAAGLGQPKPPAEAPAAPQGLAAGAAFTTEPPEGLGKPPVGEPAKPAAMLTPVRGPASAPRAQEIPLAQTPAPAPAEPQSPIFAVGDSHAGGLRRFGNLQGTMGKDPSVVDADAANGRSPKQVLDFITSRPNDYWRGKSVVLSSGVSNDPTQSGIVPQQVQELRNRGANVVGIAGFGPVGAGGRDMTPVAADLNRYAADAGLPAVDMYKQNLMPDQVHLTPQGYAQVGQWWRGNAAAPSPASAVPQRGGQATPSAEPSEYGGNADPRNMAPLIRAAAEKYGVDPHFMLQVAQREGLGNPVGDNGTSFGAMQLHVTPGGEGNAVGDLFRRETGLDPSDPKNEPATIDFAAKYAAQHGWDAWTGARDLMGRGATPASAGPGTAVAGTGATAGAPATQDQVVTAAQHVLANTPPQHRSAMAQWMDSPYFPLFLMGAGMLASRSHFPGVALGEGMKLAAQGAETVGGQQMKREEMENEAGWRQSELGLRQQQMEQTGGYQQQEIGVRQQEINRQINAEDQRFKTEMARLQTQDQREQETERHNRAVEAITAGYRAATIAKPLPSYETGPNGEIIPGTQQYNPLTERYEFQPGATVGHPQRETTYQQKVRAWGALHPDDPNGALAYANGQRQMNPQEMSIAAQRLAEQDLARDTDAIGLDPGARAARLKQYTDQHLKMMGTPAAPSAAPTAQPAAPVGPPPNAVQYLRDHPDQRGAFDQKYGAGSSSQVLGAP
jgi:hypothetical protein